MATINSAMIALNQVALDPAAGVIAQSVLAVGQHLGFRWFCLSPMGAGAPWKRKVPNDDTILTIPAKRPIKAICIRKLLAMIDRRNDD